MMLNVNWEILSNLETLEGKIDCQKKSSLNEMNSYGQHLLSSSELSTVSNGCNVQTVSLSRREKFVKTVGNSKTIIRKKPVKWSLRAIPLAVASCGLEELIGAILMFFI